MFSPREEGAPPGEARRQLHVQGLSTHAAVWSASICRSSSRHASSRSHSRFRRFFLPPHNRRIGARHADPRRQPRHVLPRPARSSPPLPRGAFLSHAGARRQIRRLRFQSWRARRQLAPGPRHTKVAQFDREPPAQRLSSILVTGQWIAFSSQRDSRRPSATRVPENEIYIIHPNGSGLRRVTSEHEFGQITYSSNRSIAVQAQLQW